MIIKKFIGKNEEEATAAARRELGASAVIMNVRQTKKGGFLGFFQKSETEVTAAIEEMNDTKVSNQNSSNLPQYQPPEKSSIPSLEEADEDPFAEREKTAAKSSSIEKKLEELGELIERQMKSEREKETSAPSAPVKPALQEEPKEEEEPLDEAGRFLKLIRHTLLDNEVEEVYVDEIISEAERLKKPGISIDYMLSSIYQKLVLKYGASDLIKKGSNKVEAVFFLGPTGVGKTTTIAKLASNLCVRQKAKVCLITTDTFRVKAAEQLRTYADILNIPFRIVYSEEDMESAIDEFRDYDYMMIDTAGHSPKNFEQLKSQNIFVETARRQLHVRVYLVLSLTTKYKDLQAIADTYKGSTAYSLIFTKLDETSSYGNMLNLRMYTGAPMSYTTNGQDVPDDISVFNAQRIVRVLLGGKAGED